MPGLFHWIYYGLGGFYAALALVFVFRASKPACRVCLYWQSCLPMRLGLSTLPPRKCATRAAKAD
jgi:hypothetical protein